MKPKGHYAVLLAAIFLSGAAGLINQIAWQRAVKVYLGNSETLSSMIVVLVFMLGLGLGSLAAAKRGERLKNPFQSLGLVEALLAVVTLLLMFMFGDGLRDYGHALQATAAQAGLSPSLVLALLSFAVLIVPCFLMGLTVPFASEAAQRQLKIEKNTVVSHFFVVNTLGAVVGTLGCGFLLMPLLGQRLSLVFASVGNLVAGVLILVLLRKIESSPAAKKPTKEDKAPRKRRQIRNEEVLAFALGALSLAYEIYLFRITALAYTPLPWIFSAVLCGFLLFWSFGLWLSSRVQARMAPTLLITALFIAAVPFIHSYHRFQAIDFPLWSAGVLYFLPCIGFGMLFGMTISRYADRWGRDVGMFNALNTAGSGVGIVAATFVLFTMDKDLDAWILGAGLLLFVPYFLRREYPKLGIDKRRLKVYSGLAAGLFVALLFVGMAQYGSIRGAQRIEFYGSSGVIEIDKAGRVYINGLWHSVLYRDDNKAARRSPNIQRKMLIALLPFLAHHGPGPKEVLNIGMGTGATARTLAKSSSVAQVDAYEIVDTVAQVIEEFPEETLGTANRSKINVMWEDARAGLKRRQKKYDIITQSPLYLKQSGSSFLLSRQYFELLRSRLKDGGIAGIYCNSQGNAEQALLVRTTVSKVFKHYESFNRGYFILASNKPIDLSKANFESKLVPDDPIRDDIRTLGIARIRSGFDQPRLDWTSSPYIVTDDHPLVEWPSLARWLISDAR